MPPLWVRNPALSALIVLHPCEKLRNPTGILLGTLCLCCTAALNQPLKKTSRFTLSLRLKGPSRSIHRLLPPHGRAKAFKPTTQSQSSRGFAVILFLDQQLNL